MEEKLREISLHLLDLGKRNRLLNYKQNGYRTIDILNEDYDNLFHKLTTTGVFIYPLDPVLSKYYTVIEGTEEAVSQYSNLKVKDIVLPLLKPNEVLCYKKGVSLERVLKTIDKETKLTVLEKGINPLYVTLGFIEYIEKNDTFLAPLLLIPVEMSVENHRYKIKAVEDEIVVNPTLSYYLKNEYKLNLEEPLEDEEMSHYFSRLEGLEVKFLKGASLGIYSFLKMNMFNDINTNMDKVLRNKNIRRLMNEYIPEEEFVFKEPFIVVNADSSQLEAVQYAVNGASFVLQGPPGSGKSQTITNIIASAIGNGKKVLFVSEKQVALNIVYENLKRVGLDCFALELHSHKANKKEFIDELYKTAVLPHYDIHSDASEIEKQYEDLSYKLKNYRLDLHKKINRTACSLYEMLGTYLSIPSPSINYKIEEIWKKDRSYLKNVKEVMQEYESYSGILGYDYHTSVFNGYIEGDLDYIRFRAEEDISSLIAFYQNKDEIRKRIMKVLPIPIHSYQELLAVFPYLESFVRIQVFLPEYFNLQKRAILKKNIESYLKIVQYFKNSTLKRFLDLKILKEDIDLLLEELNKKSKSFFKYFKPSYHKLLKSLKPFLKMRMADVDIIKKLEEAKQYKLYQKRYMELMTKLPANRKPYEYVLMDKDISSLKDFSFELELDKRGYMKLKNEFLDILVHFKENNQVDLRKQQKHFDSAVFSLVEDDIGELLLKLDKIYKNKDKLEPYAKRCHLLERMEELETLDYLDKALKMRLPLNLLNINYEALFWQANIYYELASSPYLCEASSNSLLAWIEDYKHKYFLKQETNKAQIVSKLSNLRPEDSILAGSKLSVLIKEHNKSRRQKPIRLLLSEIFELALDLKPVFLMSPLSVSTYLNAECNLFDLVIFDEASQVFAWDALGAIYRAKQCIIIGDSKQMPPSNFFSSTLSDDELSDENELESILDRASSVFKTRQLNWHYRSRSEELIAFSNREFYDNHLITVPQAKAHTQFFGVDYHFIQDGIYEAKERTNRKEAEYIAELVFKHIETLPEQSLGVVAFSTAQAELIQEMIEEKKKTRPDLYSFFDERREEAFFVKNLESVQGDERDCIIFSICYGYNKDGKFYQRFGPLNNLGGERRLNVAITRAKYNVCVVSSIQSSDIKIENTESVGVKLLKKYLEYAEHITLPNKVMEEEKDGVIDSVCKFLQLQGFSVFPRIGTSAFKIDIAVMHPITKEYLVAIMTDGTSYQLGSIADANRLQELLLKRLGWQFYRLFSPLWVNERAIEERRLLDFIQQAFHQERSSITKEEEVSFLVEKSQTFDDSFKRYSFVLEEEIHKLYGTKSTAEIIEYIIAKEEPIHREYLLKRICFIYGRTKVTNIVREYFDEDIRDMELIEKNGFLMIKEPTNLGLRIGSDRGIEWIYPLELQDAIYKVVKKSNGITKEGCFKAVLKLLGYTRISDNTMQYLEDALVFLKLEGKLIEKQSCLYV